jgi:hypothetical protein
MADVEAKLLAFQMDVRAQRAMAEGESLEKAELVPQYEKDLREEEAEVAVKLIFESGNLEIQQLNTALAGYKVRGAMKGTLVKGRLERILASQGAQDLLKQYLENDEQISTKAKQFSRMLQGLSSFTDA